MLPNGAFFNGTGGAWVFVLDPDGTHATRRAVRIGRHNAAQVEILSGLDVGDRVIISSYSTVANATTLAINK